MKTDKAVMDERLKMWAEYEKYSAARGKYTKELMESGETGINAIVKAGDLVSADQATERVKAGLSPLKAVNYVGSYARFDWAFKNLNKHDLWRILPSLWVEADPDDTKPEYLAMWREYYSTRCNRTVTDGPRLPDEVLTVYRGQLGPNVGISWTLDRKVAMKFAATGGGRSTVKGGKVLKKYIRSDKVLAYLTSREESEVVVDPKELR